MIKRYSSWDEIDLETKRTKRCPICNKPKASGMLCQEHRAEWLKVRKDHDDPLIQREDYLRYVNGELDKRHGVLYRALSTWLHHMNG